MNSYDVYKRMLIETSFLIRFIFGSTVNLVYLSHIEQTKGSLRPILQNSFSLVSVSFIFKFTTYNLMNNNTNK